ncbi:hypothetical protein BKA80DRAFT_119369 [Phyllosticta citrichinensis]
MPSGLLGRVVVVFSLCYTRCERNCPHFSRSTSCPAIVSHCKGGPIDYVQRKRKQAVPSSRYQGVSAVSSSKL